MQQRAALNAVGRNVSKTRTATPLGPRGQAQRGPSNFEAMEAGATLTIGLGTPLAPLPDSYRGARGPTGERMCEGTLGLDQPFDYKREEDDCNLLVPGEERTSLLPPLGIPH